MMCKAHSKKNRVCFVSLKAYPLFNPDISSVFGGAEVDLYMLATELANDERFEVSFIVGDYGQPPLEAPPRDPDAPVEASRRVHHADRADHRRARSTPRAREAMTNIALGSPALAASRSAAWLC